LIERKELQLKTLGDRLGPLLKNLLDRKEQVLMRLSALLKSYSYENVLERGFCLTKDPAGHIITHGRTIAPNAPITLVFQDGERQATVQ
jgi:exodeoxyribonuclease VII large subunit